MGTRGRTSAAELAVPSWLKNAQQPTVQKMPQPPVQLSPEEAELWGIVMGSRGGDLISPESYPVLVEYCRTVSYANRIAEQLALINLEGKITGEELFKWDKLLHMQDRLAGKIANLSAKLRLAPSSRVQGITAGRNADKGRKVQPWDPNPTESETE